MRPLFLLSLPRSGSTLVQRVLGARPEIATRGEPWLMLPLLSIMRTQGVRADYWHQSAGEAIGEFVVNLEGGREAWQGELREFAERVYARAAAGAGKPEAAYYLDKTPRYALVAHELLELFPDARFVFLWRQPLAVTASLLETFRGGRFEPYHFGIDLYAGVDGLLRAWEARDERCIGVRYEDLLAGEKAWQTLHEFLGVGWDPAVLEKLPGTRTTYGDPTGIAAYSAVSSEPLAKSRSFFQGRIRRKWAERYLHWLGAERLGAMGYDIDEGLATLGTGGTLSARDGINLMRSRRAARARSDALALPEGPPPIGAAFE